MQWLPDLNQINVDNLKQRKTLG